MNKWMSFSLAFAVLLIGSPATAQEQGVIKPQLLLNEVVQGMPKGEMAGGAHPHGELPTGR